jgi:FemAB-related protein (PEP-CTERM system-associated)
MALHLTTLTPARHAAWDAFVDARPHGTFFHRAAWSRVIETAFGHAPHYIMAEQDGAIVGVLPLVHVKSRLFGNTLISTPFCVYGGPLALDRATAAALENAAFSLMRRTGARAVEFRYLDDADTDWVARPDLYVTFRKAFTGDADADLKAIPRKQRAMVRRGMQNGLRSVIDNGTDRLHGVYAESVRSLGTPVFSRGYFRILAEAFAACSDVATILDGEAPVASVMNFYYRDQVLPYYGGGTAAARGRAANDFMYWEVMRRACERGCRIFDFGRSKLGTGAYDFKTYWGFEPTPLVYQFKLAAGQKVPDLNPLNPKFALFVKLWQKLPLAVAARLGPPIVRGLG